MGENSLSALQYFSKTFKTASLNIEIDYEENAQYLVKGNELLIDMFENLLINAAKYNNKEKLHIWIEIDKITEDNKDLIRITCADNGIGISDKKKTSYL
ncbi:MAG: ATP-binding protein [Promethearchaeia archaeon]